MSGKSPRTRESGGKVVTFAYAVFDSKDLVSCFIRPVILEIHCSASGADMIILDGVFP